MLTKEEPLLIRHSFHTNWKFGMITAMAQGPQAWTWCNTGSLYFFKNQQNHLYGIESQTYPWVNEVCA